MLLLLVVDKRIRNKKIKMMIMEMILLKKVQTCRKVRLSRIVMSCKRIYMKMQRISLWTREKNMRFET